MATAPIVAPSRAGGATTARIVARAPVRGRPDGGRRLTTLGPSTAWSHEPQTLLVLAARTRSGRLWLRVRLPIRPAGASGWLPRNDVVLGHTRWWITLDKHRRRVSVFDRGRLVRRFRAVIGKAATPTPAGLAAIWEKDPQSDPDGFLGPWALALTALSPVLSNFGGGPGRIAIHGRGGTSLLDPLGSAASHGCIRVQNDNVIWLAHRVGAGTPVLIKP